MTNQDIEKPVGWNVEFYEDLSDDPCLICITRKERYLLGQALRQMEWETRWEVPEGYTLPDIKALSAEMAVKLATCESLQFRQSSTDDCIMEYTSDGGETWLPMFNFALCLQPLVNDITQLVDSKGKKLPEA